MQQIKDTNAREGLADDVREDAIGGAEIHGREAGEDEVELGK